MKQRYGLSRTASFRSVYKRRELPCFPLPGTPPPGTTLGPSRSHCSMSTIYVMPAAPCPQALAESEWASNDSPSEARRDQQIKALKQALKEAPRVRWGFVQTRKFKCNTLTQGKMVFEFLFLSMQIIALLGAESADGLRGQLPAAVAANGKPADSSSLHAQLLLMQAVGGQSDRLTSFGAPNVSRAVSCAYCTRSVAYMHSTARYRS